MTSLGNKRKKRMKRLLAAQKRQQQEEQEQARTTQTISSSSASSSSSNSGVSSKSSSEAEEKSKSSSEGWSPPPLREEQEAEVQESPQVPPQPQVEQSPSQADASAAGASGNPSASASFHSQSDETITSGSHVERVVFVPTAPAATRTRRRTSTTRTSKPSGKPSGKPTSSFTGVALLVLVLGLWALYTTGFRTTTTRTTRRNITTPKTASKSGRMSWEVFQKSYEGRYRRSPLDGYKQWLNYAQNHSCEPFLLYTAIERDIAPFRRHHHHGHLPLLQWNKLQPVALNYTQGAFLLLHIQNHQLHILQHDLNNSPFKLNQHLRDTLTWLFQPVLQHTPPITTKFVFNLHPQPKSPPDAAVPIFSTAQHAFHTDNDPYHPGDMALEIANKNRNGILDLRDLTTRDLLLPHLKMIPYPTISQASDSTTNTKATTNHVSWWWERYFFFFFSFLTTRTQLVPTTLPWSERKPAILWRGATEGSHEIHTITTAESLFTGPRFDWMKLYTAYRQLDPELPTLDFAFTEFVVGETTKPLLSVKQWEEWKLATEQLFPFDTNSKSTTTPKDYQYVLDIDGDGVSTQFLHLLTSGALVFKSTQYREWYSERLRAWKDYIPVNYNYDDYTTTTILDDLISKLKWASSRSSTKILPLLDSSHSAVADQWARTSGRISIPSIIQHGKDTVETKIRPQDMQCYTYRMILEYGALFDPLSWE